MSYRTRSFCLLASLSVVCAASFISSPHPSVIHLRRKTHLQQSELEHETYPMKRFHDLTSHRSRVWHYSSPDVHTYRFTDSDSMGGRDPSMPVSAERKEDEQNENVPVHSGVIPLLSQQSDGLGSPSATVSLATALTSANIPASSVSNTGSVPAVSSSAESLSQTGEQATQSQHATPALAATSGSSSSSSAFPPALLAFILVPICVFLLGMGFALYRIYGRPGNRVPLASPMFLGDTTALGSGYHREEVIALNDPTMQFRDSVLGFPIDKRGVIGWEPRVQRIPSKSSAKITTGSIRDPRVSHVLMPPFHAQGAMNNNAPPSRVLRPHHVSRTYNRPHPAFTADPESAIPLIVNNSKYVTYDYGQGGNTAPTLKRKGKENVHHGTSHNARKHREDISTTPLNTSPRSLPFRDPVVSAVFSDMDIRLQARGQRSPSSLVSMTDDKNQLDVPSQSSTVTSTSFDIGLAMLTDFSSPNVGLCLDLSPPSPPLNKGLTRQISHNAESLATGSTRETRGDSAMRYLEHSVTGGSRGLAYLSGPSQDMILPDKNLKAERREDELDIASALAVYRTQQAGDRLKAQQATVDQKSENERREIENNSQDSPVSSASTEARYTLSDIKAPKLPTLSEMALSRADPLYESVTNELFSTYGMRMSTVNGGGQKSRVSARISTMLSWFTGPDSSNNVGEISGVEHRMSCEDPRFSEENRQRLSTMSSPGVVQPLRIGKVRKNAA